MRAISRFLIERKRKHVILFGGSFNPPHKGHVAAIRHVLSSNPGSELLVLPTYQHAFGKDLAPFEDRLKMTKAALKGVPGVRVSDLEKRLGGKSRTIRLVDAVLEKSPGARVSIAVGSDIPSTIHRWAESERLLQIADLIVVRRPGYDADGGATGSTPELSSSAVRSLFQTGEYDAARKLLPRAVFDYIVKHALYGVEIEEESMDRNTGRRIDQEHAAAAFEVLERVGDMRRLEQLARAGDKPAMAELIREMDRRGQLVIPDPEKWQGGKLRLPIGTLSVRDTSYEREIPGSGGYTEKVVSYKVSLGKASATVAGGKRFGPAVRSWLLTLADEWGSLQDPVVVRELGDLGNWKRDEEYGRDQTTASISYTYKLPTGASYRGGYYIGNVWGGAKPESGFLYYRPAAGPFVTIKKWKSTAERELQSQIPKLALKHYKSKHESVDAQHGETAMARLTEAKTLMYAASPGGFFAYQFSRDGSMIYFYPTQRMKNGGWKGVKVTQYADERAPRKAVMATAAKSDLGRYKEIAPGDLPKSAMAKLKAHKLVEETEICPITGKPKRKRRQRGQKSAEAIDMEHAARALERLEGYESVRDGTGDPEGSDSIYPGARIDSRHAARMLEKIEIDPGPWPVPDAEPEDEPLRYEISSLIASRYPEYRPFVLDFLRALNQSESFGDFSAAMRACYLPGVKNPGREALADIWVMASGEKDHPLGRNR